MITFFLHNSLLGFAAKRAGVCLSVSLLSLLTTSCANQDKQPAVQAKPDPLEQTVRVRQQDQNNPQNQRGIVVEKRLLQVVADGRSLAVNGVTLPTLSALEELLAGADAPIVTIATHKCLATATSTKILSLAQKYTRSPIAFKSFGSYEDQQCTQ